ncbi:MAG: helix-turn-helix transcriptional regulator [Anaerorhabdus sp.]|uniref:helix-turn-helix domain-containing protein n=1 Tax=Anaerorhabdus sp. TaxID=1872524 RepID=UPI002FCBB1C9
MKFNEKLLKLRKEKGYSQEELAQMLGVSRQAISKWEVSDSYPEIENVLEISKLFQVSTDYLLNDQQEEMNVLKKEREKKHYGFLLGVIISVIGLIFSAMGWYENQTFREISIGIIIQLGGVVTYELLKGNRSKDFVFYSIFVLLVFPYVSMMLGMYILNFYPSPYKFFMPLIVNGVIYIFLCGVGIVLAKIITRKDK